jgi:uncharacterized RDD family membrane protein YckC
VIDFLFAVVSVFVVAVAPSLLLAPVFGDPEGDGAWFDVVMISSLVSSFVVVEVVSVRFFGKTLGKKLMGLQVVPAEPGKKLTPARSLIRWFVVWAAWWGAFPLIGGRGEAIHDTVAGTRVVRVLKASSDRTF